MLNRRQFIAAVAAGVGGAAIGVKAAPKPVAYTPETFFKAAGIPNRWTRQNPNPGQYMVCVTMISQNQAGWSTIRAHPAIA